MCTQSVGSTIGGLLVLVATTIAWAATPAVAATPSELLQKAIYTEETVGNLDEAMKLYEQVIADGTAGQEAAAQAQYRLALCYEKKGSDAEAKAAFEALIENYPNVKDLVAEARKHLPSKELKLLPAPWILGERMQLNMTLATGLPIGTMIYKVDAAKHEGKDVTRCSTRGLVTINGASSYSEVLCDTDSFKPIESFWKHSMLGEARAVYVEDSVKINVVGKDKPFTIAFEPPVFDNEECVELFRRLPLTAGHKATLNVITSLGGNQITIPISVAAKESITVPAGTFECYKIELGLVNQTFWVSTDKHRYVVRFAAGGVTADLTKVWQDESGMGEHVDGVGFSILLPVGWHSFSMKGSGDSVGDNVFVLDPRAECSCEVNVRPKSTLNTDVQSSTETWTDAYVKSVQQTFADFRVDGSGLVNTTVANKPATRIVADFTDNGKKMRTLGVAVIGTEKAANLRFSCAEDEFGKYLPAFDEIVKNFKID